MGARFLLQPTARQRPSTEATGGHGCTGSPDDAWERVLSDYQHVLDQHRELLASVESGDEVLVVVPAFVPPTGMPPMPDSMLTWAETLSRDTEELVHQATDFLERTRPSAAPIRHGRSLTDAASSFDRKM